MFPKRSQKFGSLSTTGGKYKSTRISPSKRKFKGMGNINGYSKMGTKDISSRLKVSTMKTKSKNIIPANISNVNKNMGLKKNKAATHNDSHISGKPRAHKTARRADLKRSQRKSINRTLNRFKLGCQFNKTERSNSNISHDPHIIDKERSFSLQDSRNLKFGKSKSIIQDEGNRLKFETRNSHHHYSKQEDVIFI